MEFQYKKDQQISYNAGYAFKGMRDEVRALNIEKGWHDEERSVGDMVALLHSEVSEVLEAYRHWKFEDATESIPGNPAASKPEGVGSELADCLIRLIDMADRWNVDLPSEYFRKMKYNWTRPHKHGGKTL